MVHAHWETLTTVDVAALDPQRTVAVLPVAAVEQHGPHLPLGTDAMINRAIVRALLARADPRASVVALPPLDVGHSLEHAGYPGTLDASAETLLALWEGVGRRVAGAGLRRLVVFNTHGGQRSIVDLVALRLRSRHGMLVARASVFGFGVPETLFDSHEVRHGIHGGEVETSLMLHLHPALVRLDALADFGGATFDAEARAAAVGPEKPTGLGWLAEDLHPAGVCGNALRADAERGAALLEHQVTALQEVVAALVEQALPPPPYPFPPAA
ncbi:MAG: creatininase family protein [Ectothiorhodospiraceae bacterium]|nr:creatininase family protein [Chromatiales bacterium]MCP5156511.1 creatininase family protein [Ectothiorhodospiraceae bacterium]